MNTKHDIHFNAGYIDTRNVVCPWMTEKEQSDARMFIFKMVKGMAREELDEVLGLKKPDRWTNTASGWKDKWAVR